LGDRLHSYVVHLRHLRSDDIIYALGAAVYSGRTIGLVEEGMLRDWAGPYGGGGVAQQQQQDVLI
jgi:hypothetical protein